MAESPAPVAPSSATVPVAPPVRADEGGWTIESYSAVAPQTSESLKAALAAPSEAPAPAPQVSQQEDAGDPVPSSDAGEAPAEPSAEVDAKPADADVPAEPKPDAPKKRKTADERIAEIRAEINALTRTKHALLRDIDQARRQTTTPAPQPVASTTTPAPQPAASSDTTGEVASDPKPRWAAFEAEGKSWDDYADALDQWQDRKFERVRDAAKADARRAVEEERRQAEAQRDQAEYARKIQELEKRRPDFTIRVQTNLADIPQTPFLADVVRHHPAGAEVLDYLADHPEECRTLASLTERATMAMMEAVRETENPTAILSHFAQHPDEFDALTQLTGPRQLLALGSLATRLDGAKTQGPPSATSVTRATPVPITPIGGTRASAGAKPLLTELPLEDYIRAANKREREFGRLA